MSKSYLPQIVPATLFLLLAVWAAEASVVIYSYRGTSVLTGGGRSVPAAHTGHLALDLDSMSATYVGQFAAGSGKGRITRWQSYTFEGATLTQVRSSKGNSTVLALAATPGDRYKDSVLHFESATGLDSQLTLRNVGALEREALPKILAVSGFALAAEEGQDYLVQSKGSYTFQSAATLSANNAGKSLSNIVSEWEAAYKSLNIPASEAGGLPGIPPVSQSIRTQMVSVTGGTLPQASELTGVTVHDFQIGKYEVAWDEWKEVRDWAKAKGYRELSNVGSGKTGKHPVTRVSWLDAVKWANARSEKEGLLPVYEAEGAVFRSGLGIPTINPLANGYRLPTEAEWEWAARGGTLSNNYTYSVSNDPNAVAWHYTNTDGEMQPVGTKLSNELGIHDMSGNVYEWCWDLYDDEYSFRRIRGGSIDTDKESGMVDSRGHGFRPEYRSTDLKIGFRIARNAP